MCVCTKGILQIRLFDNSHLQKKVNINTKLLLSSLYLLSEMIQTLGLFMCTFCCVKMVLKYFFSGSTDYIDDICPYATFQLPEKPPGRPVLTAGGGAVVTGGPVLGMIGSGGSGSGGASSGASSIGSTSTTGKGPVVVTKAGGGSGSKRFGRHTGDTMYSVGNIYSGPYHSVQSPGFAYNQATLQLRVSIFDPLISIISCPS